MDASQALSLAVIVVVCYGDDGHTHILLFLNKY